MVHQRRAEALLLASADQTLRSNPAPSAHKGFSSWKNIRSEQGKSWCVALTVILLMTVTLFSTCSLQVLS